jgi:hypothetical protein
VTDDNASEIRKSLFQEDFLSGMKSSLKAVNAWKTNHPLQDLNRTSNYNFSLKKIFATGGI